MERWRSNYNLPRENGDAQRASGHTTLLARERCLGISRPEGGEAGGSAALPRNGLRPQRVTVTHPAQRHLSVKALRRVLTM